MDGRGNVYIAAGSSVRVVSPSGTISTFAGTGSCGTGVGNGGPATRAELCGPSGIALDGQGNLYVAESDRARVRKVAAGSQAAVLTVTLGGMSTQPLLAQKGITVTASCGTPCSLNATGSVVILGTPYAFRLTGASARLAAGRSTQNAHAPLPGGGGGTVPATLPGKQAGRQARRSRSP